MYMYTEHPQSRNMHTKNAIQKMHCCVAAAFLDVFKKEMSKCNKHTYAVIYLQGAKIFSGNLCVHA